jgi:hypothetical protein
LEIKAANMEEGLNIGKKLPKGRSAFRIVKGGNDSPRFVEEEKEWVRLPAKRLSFNENGIG